MICPMCKGGRKVLKKEKGDMGYIVRLAICDKCNGTGEVEMTNEEWLRSCPPQELIRFLMNVAYGGQIRNVQKRTFDEEAEKWSEWLKQPHHD